MDQTEDREEKSPKESEIETSLLMMPSHSNPTWRKSDGLELGAVNGGAILNLIDNIAGLAALRHCRTRVVTASIDRMDFLNPVHVGELLILKARVNYVGRTSMEVGVRVIREDPYSAKQVIATTAHLTFVALGEDKHPCPVPPILPQTADEKRRYDNAKLRVQARKDLLTKMNR